MGGTMYGRTPSLVRISLAFLALASGCEGGVTAVDGGLPGDATNDAWAEDAPAVDAHSVDVASVVHLDEVSINQAVEIALMRGGDVVTAPNAPIIAGRAGIVRVLLTPRAGPVTLHGTLSIVSGAATSELDVDLTLSSASDRGVLGSSLDF